MFSSNANSPSPNKARRARSVRIAIVASFAVVNAGAARAQSVRLADSLLRAGHLARAESLYYAATRNRPSDPVARKALGCSRKRFDSAETARRSSAISSRCISRWKTIICSRR
jgi:Flp pilus assembly protein TadD